ncbi:hypothetical protein X805_24060 [Sphaerotilus natans subsp. natans DSM 6575]|uniref:Glycoside hydrolase family 19 protein n=1 Tax=Sphaerotilus natans subsp. natans DSM 6575 TaxID=1286631 RepID=A0A059KKS9_9BURK|nr:glycoside hydrolase family 19 protein [Sphaerotilus natans]KDB52036.1 hypothetical protein X805_24060 [Sphaerotilus natans subsp. natans DSM 6575]
MITVEKFKQFAPKASRAAEHAAALEMARRASSVTTPRRLAHFMGQAFVETQGFLHLEENLSYRTPDRLDAVFSAVRGLDDATQLIAKGPQAIANRVYGGRLGNGPEHTGDGWRFRGSGYCHLTGKENFERFGRIAGVDIVSNPDLARQPAAAANLAFRYWEATGCSQMADRGDVEGITRAWNGPARLGLAERRDAALRALSIWGALA